jgi:hypothetical protein
LKLLSKTIARPLQRDQVKYSNESEEMAEVARWLVALAACDATVMVLVVFVMGRALVFDGSSTVVAHLLCARFSKKLVLSK